MTEYTVGVGDVPADALTGFFVGWPSPPAAAALHQVLAQSTACVVAREVNEVVGFINALSDGLLAAYLPLLEVRAEFQAGASGQSWFAECWTCSVTSTWSTSCAMTMSRPSMSGLGCPG